MARSSTVQAFGLSTGIGLVIANMVGSGVFLSAGFMAQDLSPGWILMSWVVGGLFAIAGARAYAEISGIVGRSGGEYRYLSDLLHPWLGSLAGWGSLLVGFAAAIAVDAVSAGAYLGTLVPWLNARWVGASLIIALAVMHAPRRTWSAWSQNALVLAKIALITGFVAIGLGLGSWDWPTWRPPVVAPSDTAWWSVFLRHQYWVAFTFSGWNAAIYVAEEFRNPKRDVPRAMLLGCGAVAVLYLTVNWVFVANLTPDQFERVIASEEGAITLGHLVMADLLGPAGGGLMSAAAALIFISSLSAMTFVGPRVYAEMARDGVLPSALAGRREAPPAASIALQAALALALLFGESLLELVQSAAIVLLVFSGLTAFSLLWVRWRHPHLPRPSRTGQACAILYTVGVVVLIVYGLQSSWLLVAILTVIGIAATFGWRNGRRQRAEMRPCLSDVNPPPF